MQEICYLVISNRPLSHAGHYFAYQQLDRVCRQRKTTAFGHNLDGLSGAVNDDLASLALAQVLLKMGSDVGTGGVVDVVPKFRQEVSAAKHPFSPGE